MMMPQSVRRWLHLPSRIALILGMGALSTTGAQARRPPIRARCRRRAGIARRFGDPHRRAARSICRKPAEGSAKLPLGDTPETQHLRQLLERAARPRGRAGCG